MPVLKNTRHEAFAQALAKGMAGDDAYVEAGYSFNRGNAARLKANEGVRNRVTEITSRVAEKAEWSAAERLRSLKAIHDASVQEDRRTAIASISEANKMQGSYAPIKQYHSGPNGGPIQSHTLILDPEKLKAMTSDELAALEAAIGKLHGSAGDGESRTDAEGDAEAYSGAIDGGEG